MGNVCSVSISTEDIAGRCCDCASRRTNYICKLQENLEALTTALQKLREIRNDVKRKVELAELQQMKRLDQVQGWLMRVEAMETKLIPLIHHGAEAIDGKCLGGCCPMNCITSYNLGKKVTKRLEEVAGLINQGRFEVVAENLPPSSVDQRPSGPSVGLESTFDKVWSCLKEEQTGIIGLYGLGGVGKTTLMTQINNQFLNTTHDFDVVIWAVVSSSPNLEKIQDDIWKKIGFCDSTWKSKSQDEKANLIFQSLGKKKYVILLDDVWKRLDLIKLGIPIPSRQNKSKLLFTTRSDDVCGSMGAHETIQVECLPWEKAWELFREKAGEDAFNFHPEIPKLAEAVAKECRGLPLALITIGRAMSCKRTLQEWKYAIEVLKRSASKFPGMRDDVLPLLKFTYDNLPSDKVKSCFLYCSLCAEDYVLSKRLLVYEWVCEGFLDEFVDIPRAWSQASNIFGTLLRACLLEETSSKHLKFHDVIRDMALWIACEIDETEGNFLVQTGAGLTEAPEASKWMEARRISLMDNKIKKLTGAPICPSLLTLFLQFNGLKRIADGFFQYMPKLRVLSLAHNRDITELPRGISSLVSLQHLNLSCTGIKELPIELKHLGQLKCLLMYSAVKLSIVPQQLISSLSKLLVLDMYGCGFAVGVDASSDDNETLIHELGSLKHLYELGITLANASALQKLSFGNLKCCEYHLCLHVFSGSSSLNISSFTNIKHLVRLWIRDCLTLEEIKIDWAREGNGSLESKDLTSEVASHKCFHRLTVVNIDNCPTLKDLTWLIFAPNLAKLIIENCDKMEEVISRYKWDDSEENERCLIPLAELKLLFLHDLPQLKSIHWNALPFVHLETMNIANCPKLKKLPFNSNSGKKCKKIVGKREWWNELEWEDEATLEAFLPRFKAT